MYLIKESYVLVWYFSLHASFYIRFIYERGCFIWNSWWWRHHVTMPSHISWPILMKFAQNNYAKLGIKKKQYVREHFVIFEIFFRKITIYYGNYVYSSVTLTSPIPIGPHISVGSRTRNYLILWDTSFTYLRILFQKTKNSFYQNWWQLGSIKPPIRELLVPSRSPLIFWDTSPTYLRILFQQK